MPKAEKPIEETREENDPFGDEAHPAVQYVIDRWEYIEDKVVIEGRVTEFSATMHLKRGDYQSDAISATIKIAPDNLKCDLVLNHPIAQIHEMGDDLAIVGLVFRRFGNELALQTQDIIVEHMMNCYPEPPKKDPRVSAGERKVTSENTKSSVEF